jgi:hypothetical protein
LVAPDKWEGLDPLVRARLLLAPLFMRRRDQGELAPALAKLAAAGADDKCAGLVATWNNRAWLWQTGPRRLCLKLQ